MRLIATTQELNDLCRRLSEHAFVAVDTEFIREQTFWPKLCVIQLAGPSEEAIVDPLVAGDRPCAVLRADGQQACGQGVPRGAAGPRDRLDAGAAHPSPDFRHPGRRHGVRLRGVGELCQPRQADRRPQPGQDLALHGLGAPAPVGSAACLRAGRCHPSERHLPAPQGGTRSDRQAALARRGDGRADQPGDVRNASRGRLAQTQAARQEPQGLGRADRACGLARAARPGARRAAQPHPARRGPLRHRQQCTDRDRAARAAQVLERGICPLGPRQRDRRRRQSRAQARSKDGAANSGGLRPVRPTKRQPSISCGYC